MTIRATEKNILNVSGYLFTVLDPVLLQPVIKNYGASVGIRGTVLLAEEGINCFVAGSEESILKFEDFLFREAKVPQFELKRSFSDYIPFKRFLVKIKREIISTGTEVKPFDPAPYIDAKDLKKSFDDKRDVVLLDTRNDYEIALGKFRNAQHLSVSNFRKFIAAADLLPAGWKTKEVITYCTGGIRCEKAAHILKQKGFQNVKQLRGGILKYFEECGGEHFEGECFVFDKRIGVGPDLAETDTTQCYACRAPLLPADLESEHYIMGESCPRCRKV